MIPPSVSVSEWMADAHDNIASGAIVIFDGVCKLCTRSVQWILKFEADAQLRFMPLQSDAGQRTLRQFGFDPEDAQTFVLLSHGRVYTRSDAALRIAAHFRPPWKYLTLLRIIPRPIRDAFYRLIAGYRYRIFGRRESCMLPPPDARERFIEH
jgi:predicted DCC family thiol-disulfide oxidoreductase YuxK